VRRRILVVEDHGPTREQICQGLTRADYEVLVARNGREALALMRERPPTVVVSDYRMKPIDGLELLQRVRRWYDLPFILYSAGADADAIFQAGQNGALVFLEYPFRLKEQLIPTIEQGIRSHSNPRLGATPRGAHRLVGESRGMQRVRTLLRRVASSPATVVITGETGTGKELAARAVHEESGRDPFVAIAVTELSETLLASELFGHERGAFTGALRSRPGLFERAHGGTLFLDEIGVAPPSLQAKLLRVLETRHVRPVGGDTSRPLDVRIVAGTNEDLAARVHEGSFREDLYFRLKGVTIHIPPLRDRTEDIPVLARHLLAELAREAKLPNPQLTPGFAKGLRYHPWPGNVRELRSLLQNVLLWWDGRSPLGYVDLIEALAIQNPALAKDSSVSCAEMIEAYHRCGENQEAARRELGLSRGEWRYRWQQFGLHILGRRRR